jgi:hypothetical protein
LLPALGVAHARLNYFYHRTFESCSLLVKIGQNPLLLEIEKLNNEKDIEALRCHQLKIIIFTLHNNIHVA